MILNVNQTDSTWALIPTGEIKPLIGEPVERGCGNAVAVEFDRELNPLSSLTLPLSDSELGRR